MDCHPNIHTEGNLGNVLYIALYALSKCHFELQNYTADYLKWVRVQFGKYFVSYTNPTGTPVKQKNLGTTHSCTSCLRHEGLGCKKGGEISVGTSVWGSSLVWLVFFGILHLISWPTQKSKWLSPQIFAPSTWVNLRYPPNATLSKK